MKKIGIVTFHASHNYGSMLQAYALQTYLAKLGHDVQIINLRPLRQKVLYENPNVFSNFSIKKLAKAIMSPSIYFSNIKKWHMFEDFLLKYLRTTEKEYSTYEEIQKDLSNCNFDVLISGGDQIWNQKCKDFELSFLLPFKAKGIKKISYAPSMGKQTMAMSESPYVENILTYLREYDILSVREPDASEVLSKLLCREVPIVADPAFLLEVSDYDKIVEQKPMVEGRYLFYYTPTHLFAKKAYMAAEEYARERGLKMVSSNVKSWQKDVVQVNASGPLEFLNLLKNAEFVCGQSFHLALFSLLYHKEFAVLNGDKDPRMVNLLSLFHIPNRGINVENPDFSKMEPLDFSLIEGEISSLRNKAESFIQSSLN